jgi:hypothetical protein
MGFLIATVVAIIITATPPVLVWELCKPTSFVQKFFTVLLMIAVGTAAIFPACLAWMGIAAALES